MHDVTFILGSSNQNDQSQAYSNRVFIRQYDINLIVSFLFFYGLKKLPNIGQQNDWAMGRTTG